MTPTSHRRPEAGATTVLRRAAVRAVRVAGGLVLVAAVLVLLAVTVGPRLFHYRTATMLTGSMAPTIDTGAVVLDVPEPAADIRVGQVITYQIPVDDHRVETHRVVWVGHDDTGRVLFRTRGDANDGDDPWTSAATDATAWRVRAVVPYAGTVIRSLRRPWIHLALTAALPAALVVGGLWRIWRRPASVRRSV